MKWFSRGSTDLLARVSYPVYTVLSVSGQYIVVAGGGGSAKTGIANAFQIFELSYRNNATVAEEVAWHETGDFAVMTAALYSYDRDEWLACAMDSQLQLYRLRRHTVVAARDGSVLADQERFVSAYKRQNSSNKLHESTSSRLEDTSGKNSCEKSFASTILTRECRVGFKITAGNTCDLKVDSCNNGSHRSGHIDELSHRVVRVSCDFSLLVTGSSDGHLCLWSPGDLKLLHDVDTQIRRAVIDLDISPDLKHIACVTGDKKLSIWMISDKSLHCNLEFKLKGKSSFVFKKCRYGCAQDKRSHCSLFTYNTTVILSSHDNYIVKWDTQPYVVSKQVTVPERISSIDVNDSGQFVAVGTMQSGSVFILTAFNLQTVYAVQYAHNMFVTGLRFLPTDSQMEAVTGDAEASVISTSVDNQVKIHHVTRRGTMSVFAATFLVCFVMILTFISCSYLGL